MANKKSLLRIANGLPNDPGVYRYFDKEETIIYVGKAKNLKKRVSSYFVDSAKHNQKTIRLIKQIDKIEYTIVDNEFDALLLENNLIKKHQPRYNILLKDDKTYPYIAVTKERFPRLITTRQVDTRQADYYGPFSNGIARRNLTDLLTNTFHFRTCTYNLSKENIAQKKYSVCMDYHIGKCKGPCEGLQSEENYLSEVESSKEILNGKFNRAKDLLKEQMTYHASNLDYEKAEIEKNKIISLEQFQSKSTIANPKYGTLDVYTHIFDDNKLYINNLQISNGVINGVYNTHFKKIDEQQIESTLNQHIFDARLKYNKTSKEILTNRTFEYYESNIKIVEPKIGDKKKLVDLSIKNLFQYKLETSSNNTGKESGQRILETLKADLRMTELPKHIECFDNSNIQGTNPVASMVCFKMGKPSKKDYRHFNIKTVIGPNDFDSMKEIVQRRYSRLVTEGEALPQLIIIDGGKGQLNAAKEILKTLGIYNDVAVIGIAKRLEEIYFPDDKDPVLINKKSESLKLIQKLRNEAHRFAITFHRDQRSRSFIKSKLGELEGIGPKTEQQLLQHYKSVKKIKEASQEELSQLIGQQKAIIIKKGLS